MLKHGQPKVIVTDKLRLYGAALKAIGGSGRQQSGRWVNKRVDNPRLPFRRRKRAIQRFRRRRSLQKFTSAHASVSNHLDQQRSLSRRNHFKQNRTAALIEWRNPCAE